MVQILKTIHGGHGGKLSLARVLRGQIKDGAVLHDADGRDARIGGIFALAGDKQIKRTMAQAGDTVALARLESFATGEMLSDRQNRRRRASLDRASGTGLSLGDHGAGPQGRGQAEFGHRKAVRGRSVAACSSRMPETHDLILAGQGEAISRWRWKSCRTAMASKLGTQARSGALPRNHP